MAEHTDNHFPHRRNPDGSFDSICPRCYSTVSTRQNEMELAEDEMSHDCVAKYKSGLVPQGAPLDHIAEVLAVFNGIVASYRGQ